MYVSTHGVGFISDHPDFQTSTLTRYYFSFASYAMSDSAPLPGTGNVPPEIIAFSKAVGASNGQKFPSVPERYWFTDFVSYGKVRSALIAARKTHNELLMEAHKKLSSNTVWGHPPPGHMTVQSAPSASKAGAAALGPRR
jgi:hypothetical protein